MSDTFFTSSPGWTWYIILYFFVGGIAGGAFFLAALLRAFGRPEDRPIARLGYYVACAGAILSGLLLTVDLTRPERFWHMLIQSNTGRLMFKYWSPMSVGAWGVLLFGLFSFLGALGAAAEEGRPSWKPLQWPPVRALNGRVVAGGIAVLGSVFGFFLAGYTGVLLAVTNRPIWADSTLLGALFLFSGISTGAASLILLSRWRSPAHPGSLHWLAESDRVALALELLTLVAFLVSLGSVARVFVGWWGLLLVLGVVGAGIVWPLVLERPAAAHRHLARAAALVLAGGFLLRVVVLLSSEQIHAAGSGVALP
ncbi:MAG: polysulfide reductase NrfD [Gemmatimonadetes bacterium]|nr:polysulfide reductase NrfD [Gemmatimonadota bacterium]